MKGKINQWISELELLSQIPALERQATYCAFTAGYKDKITVFMSRTIPNVSQHLKQTGDCIRQIPHLNTFCWTSLKQYRENTAITPS